MSNQFQCLNCCKSFSDDNTLAFCPDCGEMCECESTAVAGKHDFFLDEENDEIEEPPPYAGLGEPIAIPKTNGLVLPKIPSLSTVKSLPLISTSIPIIKTRRPASPIDTVEVKRRRDDPEPIDDDENYSPSPIPPPLHINPPPESVMLPPHDIFESFLPRLDLRKGLVSRGTSSAVRKTCNSIWSTFTPSSTMLLIGEGNFSFALALAKRVGSGVNMIASDIEMHHELTDPAGCDETVVCILFNLEGGGGGERERKYNFKET